LDDILENIESLKVREGEEEKPKIKEQSVDKKFKEIEKLFESDNVNLSNHFYVNPYAKVKEIKENNLEAIDVDDVIFDEKKGKLIWKEAKIKEKERRMVNENDIINENVKGKRKRSEDDSDEELTIKKTKNFK